MLLIVARGDGVRGNTSLHWCATPAWGRFHYAIGAVDAQAARAASIIISILEASVSLNASSIQIKIPRSNHWVAAHPRHDTFVCQGY